MSFVGFLNGCSIYAVLYKVILHLKPLPLRSRGVFSQWYFLLTDFGYQPYATTIETKKEVKEKIQN